MVKDHDCTPLHLVYNFTALYQKGIITEKAVFYTKDEQYILILENPMNTDIWSLYLMKIYDNNTHEIFSVDYNLNSHCTVKEIKHIPEFNILLICDNIYFYGIIDNKPFVDKKFNIWDKC